MGDRRAMQRLLGAWLLLLVVVAAVELPATLDSDSGGQPTGLVQLLQERETDQVTHRLDNGEAELSQSTAQTTAETMSPGRPVAEYIGPSFAAITWPAPPVQLLGLPTARNITGYSLTARQSGQAVKTVEVLGSTALSARMAGLQPNTEYAINVVTRLNSGVTPAGPSATFTTKATVPLAVPVPTVSKVSVTHMLLSWSAPVSGGQPIKFYRIQKQVGGSGDYSPVVENGIIMEDTGNTNVERQITGLHPGTLYAFKVQAVNSVGNGEFSKRSEPVFTAKRSVPGAPGVPIASQISTHGMTLTWEPADDRGSTIFGYQLLAKRDADAEFHNYGHMLRNVNLQMVNGRQLSTRIDNLKPGNAIEFMVRSSGKDGYGPLSPPTAKVYTEATVPGAPIGLVVGNVTSTSAILRWVSPDANGDPITAYRILEQQGSNGGFIEIVKEMIGTSHKCQGLTPGGTAYEWKIQAKNKFGLSEMSASSNTMTTLYDNALATKKVILDELAVKTFAEVRNKMTQLDLNAAQAEVEERNATDTAKQQEGIAEKATEKAKLTDVKVEMEKKSAIAERNSANANANKQFAEITKLKDEVTVTQEGKEREYQKVRKMRKEGCKKGIIAWCA